MKDERVKYFTSAVYRKTIRVGDTLMRMNSPGNYVKGTVVRINDMIRVKWGDGNNDNNDNDMFVSGGVILAFRVEDLNAEEHADYVTNKLQQSLNGGTMGL